MNWSFKKRARTMQDARSDVVWPPPPPPSHENEMRENETRRRVEVLWRERMEGLPRRFSAGDKIRRSTPSGLTLCGVRHVALGYRDTGEFLVDDGRSVESYASDEGWELRPDSDSDAT